MVGEADAEEFLAWLRHPAARAEKLRRVSDLLDAEAEAFVLRATMREVVIELERLREDEANDAK